MAARAAAINYLSPRWGGSFEILEQMVDEGKKVLNKETAHYLEYNVVLAKASHYEVIESNLEKAQGYYKQAMEMCENSEAARNGMFRTYP